MARLTQNLRPYIELTRLNRPVGIWLLALPCFWGVALAPISLLQKLVWLGIFGIGAAAMRSAGCAFNDWIDRDLDLYVKRTQGRPIAAGKLTTIQAYLTIAACCLVALIIWLLLPPLGKTLSLMALGLAIAYPFAKRWIQWPQVILGLTFNSGVLIAWASLNTKIIFLPAIFFLYAASVFWTLAYDTIYAIPDQEGDEQLEMGSLALALRPYGIKKGVFIFYWTCFSLLVIAGIFAGLQWPYYLFTLIATNWLLWRLYQLDPDDPAQCLSFFKANTFLGWAVFWGIILSSL